jgi:hypothetical protein
MSLLFRFGTPANDGAFDALGRPASEKAPSQEIALGSPAPGEKARPFPAVQTVAHGPSATSLDVRCLVAIGGKADEAQTGLN